ncbi:MAG: metal ABC transporter permease [Candidatus Altarchaeaceae archaeon]
MFEIFQYEFMRNAFIAAILIGILCGIIGTFIVLRKIVFIADGISHSAFGGVGIGYFLKISPIISAIPFSILSAIIIFILSKKTKIEENSAIGIMMVFGITVGILFMYLTPGYTTDLTVYLFGSIVLIPTNDLILMLALDLIIIFFTFLFYREIVFVSFDEEFSKIVGIKTDQINLLLLSLIALSVVVMMKAVGIILLIALLIIPSIISKNFAKNVKSIIFLSIFLGIIFSIIGLFISYEFNLPSGAVIVLVAIIGLIIGEILRKILMKT